MRPPSKSCRIAILVLSVNSLVSGQAWARSGPAGTASHVAPRFAGPASRVVISAGPKTSYSTAKIINSQTIANGVVGKLSVSNNSAINSAQVKALGSGLIVPTHGQGAGQGPSSNYQAVKSRQINWATPTPVFKNVVDPGSARGVTSNDYYSVLKPARNNTTGGMLNSGVLSRVTPDIVKASNNVQNGGKLNGGVASQVGSTYHTASLLGDIIPSPADIPGLGLGSAVGAVYEGAKALSEAAGRNRRFGTDPTYPSGPSGPLTATAGIDKPSIVERGTSRLQTGLSSGVSKYASPVASAADNSKEFGQGKLGTQSNLLPHLATDANKSKQFTGGVSSTPILKDKTIPPAIPHDGSGSTHGDGAGTIPSQPTGGSTTTPSVPSTGGSPLPMPLPLPSGGVLTTGGASVPGIGAVPLANAASLVSTSPVGSGVDLVLEDIQLESPATLVAGPAYTVKFRNQGTKAAVGFQVAILVGADDILSDDAPRAIVDVSFLAAGATGEVTLRLPQRALKLVPTNGGEPAMFTHLFVAVDLFNVVPEGDKANNTAIVERSVLETSTNK